MPGGSCATSPSVRMNEQPTSGASRHGWEGDVTRNIVAWILIPLGLAAITSGLSMGYIIHVINETEAEIARTNAPFSPYGMSLEPVRKSVVQEYGSAGVSVVVGLALTSIGLSMRVAGREKQPKAATT